jgi:hypothetical protein
MICACRVPSWRLWHGNLAETRRMHKLTQYDALRILLVGPPRNYSNSGFSNAHYEVSRCNRRDSNWRLFIGASSQQVIARIRSHCLLCCFTRMGQPGWDSRIHWKVWWAASHHICIPSQKACNLALSVGILRAVPGNVSARGSRQFERPWSQREKYGAHLLLRALGPGAVKVGCDKDQQIMTLKMLWDILISKEICLKMFEDWFWDIFGS